MSASDRTPSVAERLVEGVASLAAERLPAAVRSRCEDLLVDAGGLRAEDAAMLNGTAAHGEDFDDTFEGGPVHSGAVVVPAVLAACERFGLPGSAALLGIAAGVECLCRSSL